MSVDSFDSSHQDVDAEVKESNPNLVALVEMFEKYQVGAESTLGMLTKDNWIEYLEGFKQENVVRQFYRGKSDGLFANLRVIRGRPFGTGTRIAVFSDGETSGYGSIEFKRTDAQKMFKALVVLLKQRDREIKARKKVLPVAKVIPKP